MAAERLGIPFILLLVCAAMLYCGAQIFNILSPTFEQVVAQSEPIVDPVIEEIPVYEDVQAIEQMPIVTQEALAEPVIERSVAAADTVTTIDSAGAELVVLAGYMRILTKDFVLRYEGRLLNIHPSLLPAFPGLRTHEAALREGVKIHGCTVHFVTPALDHGPIIIQAAVPVKPDDTPDTLAARVLQQEHRIYPQAVRWFAEGKLVISDGRVNVRDADLSQWVLAAP